MEEDKTLDQVFIPGVNKLESGEELEYDSSAYEMLHKLRMDWPCLSFDVIKDKLGAQRTKFPLTTYFVAGTQAGNDSSNSIMIMKASQLHRTKYDDEEEGISDEEEDLDDDPELEHKNIKHNGCINRIRVMPQASNIVSTWSDNGRVYLWDITQYINSLDTPPTTKLSAKPIKELHCHKTEGFAMDWSHITPGRLLTGDCGKQIYLTEMKDNTTWVQATTPFLGHTDSVEDLQWSPSEETVFASCSVDKTIKIWDLREKRAHARSFKAADCDINVISWNKLVSHLLASGADDGTFRVWDLRSLIGTSGDATSVGNFKWHTDQITSIQWDPNDESVLAIAGADNQITLWDLSVEEDAEDRAVASEIDVPPQLLFVHQGQTEIKELHFHPQIPGVILSTAEDGFNIFKPNLSGGIDDSEG